MCSEHLSDELSGKALEYKDQVKNFNILMKLSFQHTCHRGKTTGKIIFFVCISVRDVCCDGHEGYTAKPC